MGKESKKQTVDMCVAQLICFAVSTPETSPAFYNLKIKSYKAGSVSTESSQKKEKPDSLGSLTSSLDECLSYPPESLQGASFSGWLQRVVARWGGGGGGHPVSILSPRAHRWRGCSVFCLLIGQAAFPTDTNLQPPPHRTASR